MFLILVQTQPGKNLEQETFFEIQRHCGFGPQMSVSQVLRGQTCYLTIRWRYSGILKDWGKRIIQEEPPVPFSSPNIPSLLDSAPTRLPPLGQASSFSSQTDHLGPSLSMLNEEILWRLRSGLDRSTKPSIRLSPSWRWWESTAGDFVTCHSFGT